MQTKEEKELNVPKFAAHKPYEFTTMTAAMRSPPAIDGQRYIVCARMNRANNDVDVTVGCQESHPLSYWLAEGEYHINRMFAASEGRSANYWWDKLKAWLDFIVKIVDYREVIEQHNPAVEVKGAEHGQTPG